jgi:hypothetical protein
MKLELKHLAPYFPYGLKGYYEKDKTTWTLDCELHEADYQMKSLPLFHFIGTGSCKPILRPLSDLTREDLIEDLGTETSCLDWTTSEREHWIRFYSREHWINNLPYLIYSHLVKNHFDVFGLIPKGLAIDINTLK